MAKVSVRKPSDEIIEAANEITYVTDVRGRRFGLKKPSVLAQFRLVDLLGAETSKNEVYMAMVMPVTWVCSIEEDGVDEDIHPPCSRAELEALISRVDEPGIIAIGAELTRVASDEQVMATKENLGNE